MLRLAITGCSGRMGKVLVQAASQSKEMVVQAATVSSHSPLKAMDVGIISGIAPLNFFPVEDLSQVVDQFDIIIDFTTPEATLSHLKICQQFGKKIVIGTTGFNTSQKNAIEKASQEVAMVLSPNMSIGMHLYFQLIKQAALVLKDTVDIEIIESHHRNKVDAPSGTALKMGEIINKALNRNHEQVSVFSRHEKSEVRDRKTLGYSSIRGGDIVGDHTVLFAGIGEKIEITHSATSRMNFAQGALKAATWLANQNPGLYTMDHVLAANE